MSSRKKWYESAFGEDYTARYAHRNDAEAALAATLLRGAVGPCTGKRALDLCCGAGRHIPHLAALGLDVSGGDLSAALIAEARRSNPASSLVRLDMKVLPFAPSSFNIVVNFFTAFGYFEDDAENESVIREVSRILIPGGWFLLDFMNADLVRRELEKTPASWSKPSTQHDGDSWRTWRGLSLDGRRAEKRQENLTNPALSHHESVRLFTQEDFHRMIDRCGLHIHHEWGDYSGAPFHAAQSPRYIFLAHLPS